MEHTKKITFFLIFRQIGRGFEARELWKPWRNLTLEVCPEVRIPGPSITDAGCRRNVAGFSKYGKTKSQIESLIKITKFKSVMKSNLIFYKSYKIYICDILPHFLLISTIQSFLPLKLHVMDKLKST